MTAVTVYCGSGGSGGGSNDDNCCGHDGAMVITAW